ncbi:MAG: endolytic transglycosylase MltG [Synergistaceae bacterium]|nr:endolytic transglycosylase MltG [Synergistaceae bacterium]
MSKIHSGVVRLTLFAAALSFGILGIFLETRRELIPEAVGEEISVLILPGQSAYEVAENFETMGAVSSAREFARQMAKIGIDKRLLPGAYRVIAGVPKDVAAQLAAMRPEVPSATILPGALFEEIAASFGRPDGEELLSGALEKSDNFPSGLRPLLPEDLKGRVVFLAPETYFLNPGDSCADELVSAASGMWWKRHGEMVPEGATSADISSLGILASIVQKEALVDSDRPIIAGVFNNRLKLGMPLQSCATVVHAWRLRGVKITSVSYNDVKVDSPFNTYERKGLPPENIGVPSESSWNAALRPDDTDMLFFFARGDGSHVFTRTYKDHLEAQKKK